jgi:hypothetical protein
MRFVLLMLAALVAAVVPATALGTGNKTVELYASLNGKNETPKGDPKATGKAEIKLNAATGRVCWEFTLKGVSGPNAAHIHKGKAGTAGAVVIPFGTAFKREGCTKASRALVAAILAKPGAYYVNVHTSKYPAGSVRGQLTRSDDDNSKSSGGYTY